MVRDKPYEDDSPENDQREKWQKTLRNIIAPTIGIYFTSSGHQGNERIFQHKYLHSSQARPLEPDLLGLYITLATF